MKTLLTIIIFIMIMIGCSTTKNTIGRTVRVIENGDTTYVNLNTNPFRDIKGILK